MTMTTLAVWVTTVIELLLGTFAVTMGSQIINIITFMVPASASAHINYFAALWPTPMWCALLLLYVVILFQQGISCTVSKTQSCWAQLLEDFGHSFSSREGRINLLPGLQECPWVFFLRMLGNFFPYTQLQRHACRIWFTLLDLHIYLICTSTPSPGTV